MNIKQWMLTVGYALLLVGVDWMLPDVVLTPLLSLCFLMVISLRWSTFACTVAAAIFSLAVFVSLWEYPLLRLIIRQLGFFVGSAIAILLSHYRAKEKENREMMEEIIHHTDVPMIVADIAGTVLCANQAAIDCIPEGERPVLGQTFQDVFLAQLPPGQAMQQFTDSFLHAHNMPWELQIIGTEDLLPASRTVIGKGRNKMLLVYFLQPT